LDYLINDIVAEGDLADSHAFVRDRTRSIRQDFTLQNNRGLEAVEAHETIARYHILCMHQLCENKGFSEQQEMEQLRKGNHIDTFFFKPIFLRLENDMSAPNN